MKENMRFISLSTLILITILATVLLYPKSEIHDEKKRETSLMGIPGKGDNPGGASSFRHDMVSGQLKTDVVAGRNAAIRYVNDFMQDYSVHSDIIPYAWIAKGPVRTGGRVRSIIIKPGNSDFMLAGSVSGGIWKTINGGMNWSPMTDTMSKIAIGCMALDPGNPDIVYAGCGEGWGNEDAVYGGGILRSENFGDTWTVLDATRDSSKFGNVLSIDVSSTGKLYVLSNGIKDKGGINASTSNGGLFRSNNNGSSFERISFPAGSNIENPSGMMIFDDSNILVATSYIGASWGKMLRSSDAGINWNAVTAVLPQSLFSRVSFAKDKSNPGTAFAVYDSVTTSKSPSGLYGIYRTTNYGSNWTILTRPPKLAGANNRTYMGNLGWYANVIEVSPHDSLIILIGGLEMMKSSNRGANWYRITRWNNAIPGTQSLVHADHHVIALDPNNPNRIINGNDGGIYRSINKGEAWDTINNDISITQFYGGAVYHSGQIFLGGTQDNGHIRYISNNKWKTDIEGDGGYAIQHLNSAISLGEYVFMDIYKTINAGISYSDVLGLGDKGNDTNALFIAPMSMNKDNPSIMCAGSNRVWASRDAGSNWSLISNTVAGAAKISAVTIIKNDTAKLKGYAGTTNGKILRCNIINLNDSNNIWSEIQPAGNSGAWVRRIVVDSARKERVYACYSGYTDLPHVYFSNDSGTTWSDISSDLPKVPVHSLVISPLNMNTLFLGTETGVFTTTNNGGSWMTMTNGLPKYVPVDELVLQSSTKKLFAFTHGRGMWELALDTVNYNTALHLQLANEFYDSTTNQHRMTDTFRVSLRSTSPPYEIKQEVASTIDYFTRTGAFVFNNVPTGTYYIVVRHRNSIETWSKEGGEDFSWGNPTVFYLTLSPNFVYGGNVKQVDNTPVNYAIYGGDINQDGTVDGTDFGFVDNDALNFKIGYLGSDINGDMLVDASDVRIVDNNSYAFVSVVRP